MKCIHYAWRKQSELFFFVKNDEAVSLNICTIKSRFFRTSYRTDYFRCSLLLKQQQRCSTMLILIVLPKFHYQCSTKKIFLNQFQQQKWTLNLTINFTLRPSQNNFYFFKEKHRCFFCDRLENEFLTTKGLVAVSWLKIIF